MSLRQLDDLTAGKGGGTVEGGVLVTQERTTDADAAKVDANAKSDASDTSDASDGSKIDTPKDLVKPKTSTFSTCVLILVHYKVVH